MREGVKQLVLSVCQFVSLWGWINFEFKFEFEFEFELTRVRVALVRTAKNHSARSDGIVYLHGLVRFDFSRLDSEGLQVCASPLLTEIRRRL